MNSGFLSNYFTGVGTKVLTRVDATPHSNQHEIGDGNRGDVLMRILGKHTSQEEQPVQRKICLAGGRAANNKRGRIPFLV